MKRVYKVFNYAIHEMVRPVLIFYLVIVLIIALTLVLRLAMPHLNFQLDGMRMATTIFLFVMGLNSFKSGYLFLQANGVTRKHFYAGGLLSLAAAAVVLTAIDSVLYALVGLAMPLEQRLSAGLYPGSGYFAMVVWTVAINLLAMVAGWFITMLYYRCGKGWKIAISLFPAVIVIGLPILSDATGGKLLESMAQAFTAVMGMGDTPNAFLGAFTMFIAAAAASGLCFLLVRHAPVKEQER